MTDTRANPSISNQEFEGARFKSLLNSLKYILVGRNNELLSFDKVKREFELSSQKYLGAQTVKVDDIVGSLDRYKDFDRYFLPKKEHLQERWARIHGLIASDVILPPVKLYKVGEMYFVLDGNHRVSVSRKQGVKYIDAEVTEFITGTKLTPDMDPNKIFILAGREKFFRVTGLKEKRPDIKVEITAPGQYEFLLSQVNKLMVQLNENRKVDEKIATFKDASLIWYENIYIPAIEIIKHYGLCERFPGRTETDLYIWINDHKRYLSLKYGSDVVIKFAAKDFLFRFSTNPLRRFKLKLTIFKFKIKEFFRNKNK
ncbi:MAG: hypothetical protein U9O59_06115 [Actinomycetota bacterium]|nr:hypothetical protein [Actinomycetota bacterium]